MLPVAKIHQSPCSVRCRDRNVSRSGYHGRILDQAYNIIWRRMGSFRGNRWAVHSPRFSPCISLSPFLATPQPSSTSTMSTRHSFLSTTGLIRPTSLASAASVADSYYVPSRHARSGGNPDELGEGLRCSKHQREVSVWTEDQAVIEHAQMHGRVRTYEETVARPIIPK